MGKTTGWVAAALVAATGCGGGASGMTSQASVDEHAGPDEVCGACAVTGSGSVQAQSGVVDSFAIDVQPGTGAGSGGVGLAATGRVTFDEKPFAVLSPISGTVDTIERCVRQGGTLTATVSGTVDGASGGRFEAVVFDRASNQIDTIEYSDPRSILGFPGDLHVSALAACAPPPTCGEGQCLCAETGQCESCPDAFHPPPPTCLPDTCWNPQTSACEPCAAAPTPPPALAK